MADLRADVRRVGTLLGRDPGAAGRARSCSAWSNRSARSPSRRARRPRRPNAAPQPTRCTRSSPRCRSRPRLTWCGPSRPTSSWPTARSRCTGSASCGRPPAAEGHLARPPSPRSRRHWDRTQLAHAIAALAVQPVFTAHPTEASRRSVLHQAAHALRTSWPRRPRPGSTERARQDRKLAELIDLLWQTDELRHDRPTPVDEARNALYYLEAIVADTIPELTDTSPTSSTEHGVRLPAEATPLLPWAAGSAATGTATRTSPRRSRTRSCSSQHLSAIKIAIRKVDDLLLHLSSSTTIVPGLRRARRLARRGPRPSAAAGPAR